MNIKYLLIGIPIMIGSTFLGVYEYRQFSKKIKMSGSKSVGIYIMILDFIEGGGLGLGMILPFLIGFLFLGSGLGWW